MKTYNVYLDVNMTAITTHKIGEGLLGTVEAETLEEAKSIVNSEFTEIPDGCDIRIEESI